MFQIEAHSASGEYFAFSHSDWGVKALQMAVQELDGTIIRQLVQNGQNLILDQVMASGQALQMIAEFFPRSQVCYPQTVWFEADARFLIENIRLNMYTPDWVNWSKVDV